MNAATRWKKIRTHCFLVLVMCAVLLPFVYIVLISFGEGVTGTQAQVPDRFSLNNYAMLFKETKFLSWLGNSLLVSLGAMAVSTLLVSVSTYVFSRLKFAGRVGMFNFILLIQVFPLSLSMVSLYKIFIALGLINKLPSLILIDSVTASAGLVLLAKGYFDTIPIELDEAALIDGANRMQVLWRITLPLAKPMFAIVGVQSFVIAYNEYVLASAIMSQGLDTIPLAVGLQSLIAGQYGTNWSLYCAGAVLGSVPMLLLFYSLQKYFIGGLTDGGVKG